MDNQQRLAWLDLGEQLVENDTNLDQLMATLRNVAGIDSTVLKPTIETFPRDEETMELFNPVSRPANGRHNNKKAERKLSAKRGNVKTGRNGRKALDANNYDPVCDKMMSSGYTVHMRKHERNNEAHLVPDPDNNDQLHWVKG